VITVVAELSPMDIEGVRMEELHEPIRREYRGILEKGVSTLNGEVPVEAVLEQGDPAAILAQQGVELDLLVIGSRGYGPIRGTLLGGVSAKVIRTAPCPILVTPRASQSGEAATAGTDHG
jgi:nucleotide-binding universal stress UspA family protein